MKKFFGRLMCAVPYGLYFGLSVFIEVMKVDKDPTIVSMLTNVTGSKMAAEVRIDGHPVRVVGGPF